MSLVDAPYLLYPVQSEIERATQSKVRRNFKALNDPGYEYVIDMFVQKELVKIGKELLQECAK